MASAKVYLLEIFIESHDYQNAKQMTNTSKLISGV